MKKNHPFWVYILAFLLSQMASGLMAIYLEAVHFPFGFVNSLAVALVTGSVLGIAAFYAFRPSHFTWHNTLNGLRWPHLRWTLLSLLAAPPIILIVNLLQEHCPELPDTTDGLFLQQFMQTPAGVIVLCLLGPLNEELLFRAGVLGSLQALYGNNENIEPRLARRAIVISALVFSIAHLNPVQMPGAFVLGLLMGYAYWHTRSIAAPLIIHIFNNSLACAFPMMSLTDMLGGKSGAIIAFLAALTWLIVLRIAANARKT